MGCYNLKKIGEFTLNRFILFGVALTSLLITGCSAPATTTDSGPAAGGEALPTLSCPDGFIDSFRADFLEGGIDESVVVVEGITGIGFPSIAQYSEGACVVTIEDVLLRTEADTPEDAYHVVVGIPDAYEPIQDALLEAGYVANPPSDGGVSFFSADGNQSVIVFKLAKTDYDSFYEYFEEYDEIVVVVASPWYLPE